MTLETHSDVQTYQKLRYYVAEQVRKTKGTISLEYALADESLIEVLGCQE